MGEDDVRNMKASAMATLASLVSRLGRECPWTKSQATSDMLYWTRKECLEVEEVLRAKEIDSGELTKELGDVLFDVLMMIEVSSRAHPDITLEACAASACKKLERRSPYLFDGPVPATLEEAEAAWQAGKQLEQAEGGTQPADTAPIVSPVTQLPPSVPMPAPGPAATSPITHHSIAEDDGDDDAGLTEWERDFRRGAGPPSESEDEEDEAAN